MYYNMIRKGVGKTTTMKEIILARKTKYFKNLDDQNFNAILRCLNARIDSFSKGEFVVHMGDKISHAILVLSGSARSVTFDSEGNEYINLDFKKGNIFGINDIIIQNKNYSDSLFCLEDTIVLYLDKFRLLNPTQNRCQRHIELMKACFEELARQNKEIEIHKNILLLSKTKDKILAYLNYYSHYVKSNSFEIPYSREEFAIYLGVERSALSDTLSKMKKVGLIDYNRSNFKIKNID